MAFPWSLIASHFHPRSVMTEGEGTSQIFAPSISFWEVEMRHFGLHRSLAYIISFYLWFSSPRTAVKLGNFPCYITTFFFLF